VKWTRFSQEPEKKNAIHASWTIASWTKCDEHSIDTSAHQGAIPAIGIYEAQSHSLYLMEGFQGSLVNRSFPYAAISVL
jgi:hypothetical protein